MPKREVIVQDMSEAVGNYYGHLIYWPDLQRIYADHKRTWIERVWRRLEHFAYMRAYRATKRQAGRELRAWGIRSVSWNRPADFGERDG